MRRVHLKTLLILSLIAAGAFLAGYWVNSGGNTGRTSAGREVLYYVDPMNPAYRSDKPGISPSCGMPLEPVYADRGGAVPASMPPGTIRITSEKQQLIGVKTATVEKVPWRHSVRVLGRVTPNETRVYRMKAPTSGWIEEVLPVTTGSLVKKNALLATFSFYSSEYRTALLTYLSLKPSSAHGPGGRTEEQATTKSAARMKELRSKEYESLRLTGQRDSTSQIDYYRQILLSYGLSEDQLKEMERNPAMINDIEILAPTTGFILFRDVSPGQRFERGEELFRIADLSRVWVTADVFENEASLFIPGLRVRMELPYRKESLPARMSDVLPQFDPTTRTLKIRLEADNPGFVLRPDMFVNVEIPVSGPAAIIIPADAVVDSGLKKTVFVDRGNGYFEPRPVEKGRSLGERVEIVRGLMPGEKIVVAGNFLIDSEARMQQAAAGITGKISRDPVCGMNVDEDRARAEGNFLEYRGRTYFFCEAADREAFRKDPERYLNPSPGQKGMPAAGGSKDSATKGDHQGHEAVSGPRDAKTAHQPHGEMTMPMPALQPSRAMQMPGAAQTAKPQAVAPMIPPPSAAAPGAGEPTPAFPGPGAEDMPMPGSPDGAPMPAEMPMVMAPAAPDNPAPTLPGPGGGISTPGSPGPQTLSPESRTDRSNRTTSRPPRRRGGVPFEGGAVPGAPRGPSEPTPAGNGIVPPGTAPGR